MVPRTQVEDISLNKPQVTQVGHRSIPWLSGAQLVIQQPMPWAGVTERIMIYGYLLWVVVLAIVLLRAEKKPS
jgi:hypothetical protein